MLTSSLQVGDTRWNSHQLVCRRLCIFISNTPAKTWGVPWLNVASELRLFTTTGRHWNTIIGASSDCQNDLSSPDRQSALVRVGGHLQRWVHQLGIPTGIDVSITPNMQLIGLSVETRLKLK